VSASYRYIVRSPDVRGGESIESITATCLPMLTKAQVYECLAYYEDHRGEVDLPVARQMAYAHDQQ